MNNWSNFELLVDMKQIHIKIKIKYLSVYSLVYVNTVGTFMAYGSICFMKLTKFHQYEFHRH